jgi:cell shape-determining protein MreD
VIRYTLITILLVLAAFVLQQFLPAFTGFHSGRILLVQLVFLCAAVTVGTPTMLLLAFIGGFLWDAQCTLGPAGGDAEIYSQPVEALRFGSSIVLFGLMGYLMQGIQPLFRQGKWQFSALLSGIAIFLYLSAEYALITFVRGEIILTKDVIMLVTVTSLMTMIISPLIFWMLFKIANLCHHTIRFDGIKRRNRKRYH